MNDPLPPCIEFIRHGLPEGGNRYRGSGIDDPLSDTGWQQMRDAMARDNQWDLVVSSPMRRCREFAEAFALENGLDLLIENDLTEVGFGAWEGKTKLQLQEEDPQLFAAFYRDAVSNRPAGAEPLEALRRRVAGVFDRLCADHPKQRVLVVAHAGVMRIVLMHVLQIPLPVMYRINIDYATRLRFRAGEPVRVLLD